MGNGRDVIKHGRKAEINWQVAQDVDGKMGDALETRDIRAQEARSEIEGELGEHYKAVVAVAAKCAELRRNEKGEITTVIIKETDEFRQAVLDAFAGERIE